MEKLNPGICENVYELGVMHVPQDFLKIIYIYINQEYLETRMPSDSSCIPKCVQTGTWSSTYEALSLSSFDMTSILP